MSLSSHHKGVDQVKNKKAKSFFLIVKGIATQPMKTYILLVIDLNPPTLINLGEEGVDIQI